MAEHGTAFFMYHELSVPNRALCHREPGYTRYVVSASDFRSHMEDVAHLGWRAAMCLSAIQSFNGKTVCVTFDDGCETDLLAAAPILKELDSAPPSTSQSDFWGNPDISQRRKFAN